MDVEKTMQFLIESAAQHDARLAEIEKNNVLIQRAVLGLAEHQGVMQTALEETQKLLRETQIETDRRLRETDHRLRETDHKLRELGEVTDRRIGQLVVAIGQLAEHRPNAG
jgi:hypothetical protein